MQLFSLLIQVIDVIISAIVSIYNIVVNLYAEILYGTAIIILVLLALYLLRALRRRNTFIKAVKEAAKENGVKLHFKRPTILSMLWNFKGYDIEFDLRGIRYRIKLAPLITAGIGVHLTNANEAVYLGRLATRRALRKGKVKGIRIPLKYDTELAENTVNLLVFSPKPIAVTEETENGSIWEMDTENGELFGGVLVFTDDILISRLPRLIDGYIDTLIHTDEV